MRCQTCSVGYALPDMPLLDMPRRMRIAGCPPLSVLRLVLRGRHARVALEVAAEERLVREVQVVGDLLYAHR